VVPVASWGDQQHYLDSVRITVDESPAGQGPVGTALRSGQISIVDSIDELGFAPWREEALARGYRAVAALPLKSDEGTLVGALALYSDQARFFTPIRQAMFLVLAEAASAAIENARIAEMLAARTADLEATIRGRTEEIAQRNEQLAQTNAQLAEASQYKTEFLSHMSHDLRSPLTAILGFAEVLKDELYGPLNARQKEHLGHIWQAGRQLLDVIDDVVELSRIESGRLVLDTQDCYPRQVLEAAASQLAHLATTTRVTIAWNVRPDAEQPITIDPRKIKQALFNLGSHAIRSAGSGGRVTIVADATSESVSVEVAWVRPGPMIVPIDLTIRRAPGFAVSLAHRLVEMHRGHVARKDTPEGGAFVLVLPLPGGVAAG